MIYLIIYDISLDRLRTRISKRIIAEGYVRLQLSVFVGIKNPKSNKKLWSDLNIWLDKEQSSKFYVLKLTENNFRKMENIGYIDLDIDFLTGSKLTMFI